jgi:large conductance mechanosensitive channel
MKFTRLISLWREFKGFAFKGNMLDLAVGVVLGTAFGKVVNSIVSNLIMPAVSYLVPTEGGYRTWTLGKIEIGAFLNELVTFLVIAAVIFLVVAKIFRALVGRAAGPAAPATTKTCPMCCSTIPLAAKRCPQCTSTL